MRWRRRHVTIQIHNTLSRSLETLRPPEQGQLGLYLCGPTVYDDCHIGHLMGPVLFDAIVRWLRARGYRVRFVNNITDIDDKIIDRARRTGEDWRAITVRYTRQYFSFLERLHVDTITDHPRCTEFIPPMIEFTQELVDKGRAYVAADGVYYDVQKQPGYGKLSGRRLEDAQAGARVQAQGDLRHPADFALWKKAKPGEPTWPSPWGDGRPGWHLECSVMASALLGTSFDIHGGGDDLKFPHHENEVAQSEGCGHAYAHIWMHHGLVQFGGKKIAKSDPRMQDPAFAQQFQAKWLMDTYGAPTLRFFLLRGHYRRPIDFEPQNLDAARKGLLRMAEVIGDELSRPSGVDDVLTRPLPGAAQAARDAFAAAMDADFNTGEAIAALFTLAAHARKAEGGERLACALALRDLGRLLGLFMPSDHAQLRGGGDDLETVGHLMRLVLELRQDARARKDFASADKIRDALTAVDITIKDGKDGTTWTKGT
ncbi:MAG: cysteine--tRNA ligase [Planctomycetota bacterium]